MPTITQAQILETPTTEQRTLAAGSYLQMLELQRGAYADGNRTFEEAGQTYPSLRLAQVEPLLDYWQAQIDRRFPHPQDTDDWEAIETRALEPWQQAWAPVVVAARAAVAAGGQTLALAQQLPLGDMPALWSATRRVAAALDSSVPGMQLTAWERESLLLRIPEPFTVTLYPERKKKKKKTDWGDVIMFGLLLLALQQDD